ncbi:AAA family ATPase [Catellatospora tritici]|uniref:AAA family ATPase n=1 Tax=Catellatospora tritici TaxID=2851566 RepID=UPI001C2CFB68|nr:AAA family ATPase [Catellatospora tritici]MBV1849556.1 AAA family ATPase [Catellatospora tritici]
MARKRTVVLNGDLGSGKSTVSIILAERLGIRRVSVGDLYRKLAADLGMNAMQINLHAQLDDKTDHYVDQLQRDIAASGEQLVVDSRLAWHFFADALKVHLLTEPTVAARRVLGRPADTVESYTSLDEARNHLAMRSEIERVRFLDRYNVDKTRLRNYDLVCDSTRATPEQIADLIMAALDEDRSDASGPACFLDPRRIYPTALPPSARRSSEVDAPIEVAYSSPNFFAVHDHSGLSAAVAAGPPLVRVHLVHAEAGSERPTPDGIAAWERAHGITMPPMLSPAAA